MNNSHFPTCLPESSLGRNVIVARPFNGNDHVTNAMIFLRLPDHFDRDL